MRLPIDDVLPDIAHALRESTSLVLEAPPGAGKTTRVPLALLDAPWVAARRIVLLEPRRLAARAAATFMAARLGEEPGGMVGYRMRMDTRTGPRTRLEVVTEGVLTRMLQNDASLEGVAVVLFDEFHERSVQADLGLALCLQARALLRPDLRIIVMSATLAGDAVAALLGGAMRVHVRGRLHPVQTHWLERPRTGRIEDGVALAVRHALEHDPGDILAFLPGGAEIRRTAQQLAAAAAPDPASRLSPDSVVALRAAGGQPVDLFTLYGDLPREVQQRAIEPAANGRRKVVLATSIAETSLTIEGVRIVIDGGLLRVPRFSPRTGMTRLETVRVTRDAADQRRGRAGRVAPGVCYRLWTAQEETGFVAQRTPEILEADLAPLALELAVWGVTDPHELRWLDAPPAAAFAQARELLAGLGALDAAGRVTEHGRSLAALPAHPRLAHMLIRAASIGAIAHACDVAALLDERDILRSHDGAPDPDVRLRLDLLQRARAHAHRDRGPNAFVDRGALARVLAAARDWRRRVGADRDGTAPDWSAQDAGRLLAFAYPDRIARRRGRGRGRFVLRTGAGARMRPDHALAGEDFIVAALLSGHARDSTIWLAASLDASVLASDFGADITTERSVAWDARTRHVRAVEQRRLGALVLARRPIADADPDAVVAALLDAIRSEGAAALPWTDAATRVQQRVAFLRTLDPAWPDLATPALMATLDDWLAPHLYGRRSLDDLRTLDPAAILLARLTTQQRAQLDALAPTHCAVPSGSRIAIDYGDPAAPALAVRLQELFGCQDTPRVGGGRIPLTLRLLSPAMRPVQVTRDLASFWRYGYFDVRKDLRGRYPKHHWPDDPLRATPTRRTRPPS